MNTWPFESVALAKRTFDKRRVELMRVLAEWTTGKRSFDGVPEALAAVADELEALRVAVHRLQEEPGRPRDSQNAPIRPNVLFAAKGVDPES